MAKITRKTQKIFASSAADVGQFGSGQLGTKVITTDPTVIQALGAWVGGWLNATIGANKFPPLEEMNGIQLVNTYQLSYLFQEGIPEYDAGTTYFINSVVKKAGTYQLYGSVTDDNVGNPLTDAANWKALANLDSSSSFGSLKITSFTGNGTWTPDAANLFTIAAGCGSGGSGGGVTNGGSAEAASGGAGAASGIVLLTKAQAGASQGVTIGAAATGATAGGNNGNAGNATSVGSLFSLPGGGAGTASNNIGGTATTPGGTGGVPSLTTGTAIMLKAGEDGGYGGQNVICIGGKGGNSIFGNGGPSLSGNGGNFAGLAGNGYGSGSSGAIDGVGGGGTTKGSANSQPGFMVFVEILHA